MADTDALSKFDFSQVSGNSLFLKFEPNKPVKLRILTKDPLVYLDKFGNTRMAFVVFNLTDNVAQILQAPSGMAKRIGELHVDPDFGSNIQKIDIKITPTGSGMERRYTIDPITLNVRELTSAELKAASGISLEDKVGKDAPLAQRMSFYDNEKFKEAAGSLKTDGEAEQEARDSYDAATVVPDTVVEDIGDEPIDLNDIPF